MFYLTSRKLSVHALKVRSVWMTLSVSPLIGSYVYSHTQLTSPFFCPIKTLTGIPCPSCGMTRSFLALAQGNLNESLNYHLFGFILFLGLLLTTVHLLIEILTQRKLNTFYHQWISTKTNQISTLMLLLLYHGFRLHPHFINGELLRDFKTSPLGQLF